MRVLKAPLLDLKKDGTFKYYRYKTDLTDNYYVGTYKVYKGNDAIKYITNDLSHYGYTKSKIESLFTSETYALQNFYCLVLNNDECIVNGENTFSKPVITPYLGFYIEDDRVLLHLINMNTSNSTFLTTSK